MDHGKSTLIKPLNATILAGIIFLVAAVDSLSANWATYLVLIIAAAVFYAIDKNPFVRRAAVISGIVLVIMLILNLLFVVIADSSFLRIIFWLINVGGIAYLVLSGVFAFQGKKAPLPFLDVFVDSICA